MEKKLLSYFLHQLKHGTGQAVQIHVMRESGELLLRAFPQRFGLFQMLPACGGDAPAALAAVVSRRDGDPAIFLDDLQGPGEGGAVHRQGLGEAACAQAGACRQQLQDAELRDGDA